MGANNYQTLSTPIPYESEETENDLPPLSELLAEELKRMEQRLINGEPRTDSKFTILKSFVAQLQTGTTFESAWEELKDHEKFAIITRLENATNAVESEDVQQRLWAKTITPLRKELGIDIEYEEDGEVCIKTDLGRINELEQKLQDINKEREIYK